VLALCLRVSRHPGEVAEATPVSTDDPDLLVVGIVGEVEEDA